MCLNSAVFKVINCENRKLPFSCLKHPFCFQHLHKNPKWTAIRHSPMVNVAKHALSSKIFSPLFTQAWKLLSRCFLFLLSIYRIYRLEEPILFFVLIGSELWLTVTLEVVIDICFSAISLIFFTKRSELFSSLLPNIILSANDSMRLVYKWVY